MKQERVQKQTINPKTMTNKKSKRLTRGGGGRRLLSVAITLVMILGLLPAVMPPVYGEKTITTIKANSAIFPPTPGQQRDKYADWTDVEPADTLLFSVGSGNVGWYKLVDGEWEYSFGGIIDGGKWKFFTKVEIHPTAFNDGFRFGDKKDITATINGETWKVMGALSHPTYSQARIESPEYEITDLGWSITGVTISPKTVTVQQGEKQAFTAEVQGTGDYDPSVEWYYFDAPSGVPGIAISNDGVLSVGPSVPADTEIGVFAMAKANKIHEDMATVTVAAKPKLTPVLTVDPILATYTGASVPDSAIRGTAKDGATTVPGTWRFDGAVPVDAGTYSPTVRFIPTDTATYNEATAVATLTIHKADPMGVPTYTKLTTAGKTLADADLKIGSITPAGTIAWESGATAVAMANKSYGWTFTPTDATNYNTLTGNITPYVVSTGGGGGSSSGGSGGGGSSSESTKPDKPEEKPATPPTPPIPATTPDQPATTSDQKSFQEKPLAEIQYTDVSEQNWYHSAVRYVVSQGLMTGTGADNFSPNVDASRGMIVTILYQLAGTPETTSAHSFADVVEGTWYSNPVLWAANNNIVSGFEDGNFKPNQPITREQLVTILYQYSKSMGYDMSEEAELSVYTDQDQISGYANPAMKWAVKHGILTGMADGTIAPRATATRAQLAVILGKYIKSFVL